MSDKATEVLLGVVLPVLLVGVILLADAIEGPKTAYVGVLAVVPMLAAVFARPLLTFIVGAIAWTAAFTFGHFASDGNVTAQTVRLIIIGLSTLAAVGAATLRMRREAKLGAALEEAGHAETLRIQAESDSLTGLLNRRGLLRLLESGGTATTRTLTLMDCDKLKIINDEYGHLAGDEFLRALAGRVRSNLASQDHIGRWGGDEFLVFASPSTPPRSNCPAGRCRPASPSVSPSGSLVRRSTTRWRPLTVRCIGPSPLAAIVLRCPTKPWARDSRSARECAAGAPSALDR